MVVVTENFLPKVDGVTRCLARLLKHLREEGHQVLVLGPEVNMSSYETYPIIGTMGIPLMLYPDLKLNFLRPKFLRAIREFNPDVIHVVDPIWLGPQVLFALQSGWCGSKWISQEAPIVASFHTNLPTYASLFGLKFLEPVMWSWIQRIHAQCRLTACPTLSTAAVLMQKGICNTRIWPRGVDLSFFGPHKRHSLTREGWGVRSSLDPLDRCDQRANYRAYPLTPPPSPTPSADDDQRYSNEQCVILYTGRLSYEKNLLFLVESYQLLLEMLVDSPSPPIFVFVGDGPARLSLEELCRVKRIPAKFMGHLSGEQLAESYASADVFAFPSYTETFGQVVLEALASGLPVVGLDADGTRDLVQHGRSGLLLQHRPNRMDSGTVDWNQQFVPGSPRFQELSRQYAALLRKLVSNRTLRGVMGECALSSTPVGRSWGAAMGCMVECYHEVARADRQEDILDGMAWGWTQLCLPMSFMFIVYCLGFLLCLSRR